MIANTSKTVSMLLISCDKARGSNAHLKVLVQSISHQKHADDLRYAATYVCTHLRRRPYAKHQVYVSRNLSMKSFNLLSDKTRDPSPDCRYICVQENICSICAVQSNANTLNIVAVKCYQYLYRVTTNARCWTLACCACVTRY